MTGAAAPPPPSRNHAIQRLRAVAALAVVADHCLQILAPPGHGLGMMAESLGMAGVTVFFVISGYVMMAIGHDRFGEPGAASAFIRARVARVVPLYWLVTLAVVAVPMLSPSARISAETVAASLLLVPVAAHPGLTGLYPVLSVGWTLNFEMAFYALFALALWRGRAAGIALLAMVLGAIALSAMVVQSPTALPSFIAFYWSALCGYFLAGILLALAERRGVVPQRRCPPLLPAIALMATFVLFRVAIGGPMTTPVGLACCSAAVFACLLNPAPSASRIGERLGDASYSLYLIHAPLLWALAWVAWPMPAGGRWALAIAGGLFAVAMSRICYQLIERPLVAWTTNRLIPGATPKR